MKPLREGIGKYFIAIVPPSPFFEQAEAWKQKLHAEFNTKAALRSPAHITLHMPFEWKDKKRQALLDGLRAFTAAQQPFTLKLNNFGCFPPRVIFIHVEATENLQQLQQSCSRFCRQEFQLFNATRLDLPYHPHLTIAFRDLKKKDFEQARALAEQARFTAEFEVTELVLLQHDGKVWHVAEKFELGLTGECDYTEL